MTTYRCTFVYHMWNMSLNESHSDATFLTHRPPCHTRNSRNSKSKRTITTYSNMKNNTLVSRMRPRVRGSTPLCRAIMILPSQQKRFFPWKTSHFLRCFFAVFSSSFPLSVTGWGEGVGAGVDSASRSICWYSQFFIISSVGGPISYFGKPKHLDSSCQHH